MERNVWPPEKTGVSSGPVQCRTPRTAPPTGKGRGRMARVFRRSFASTPGTLALSLYWPVSGFKSMSPASYFHAESARLNIGRHHTRDAQAQCAGPCANSLVSTPHGSSRGLVTD